MFMPAIGDGVCVSMCFLRIKSEILRNIFAFLLAPAVGAGCYVFVKNLLYFTVRSGNLYVPFWVGIICYIIFQIVFNKPIRTYIFGHELSHAIAGILSGAKIKRFKISKKFGNVVLTKDNICITLAPYFFPIYTFAIIIIYFFLDLFANVREFHGYFLFLVGFSIAFHIALTIHALTLKQPDLKVYGVFFSFVVIFAVNITTFTLIVIMVFPNEINLKSVSIQIFSSIVSIYKFIYNGALEIWSTFQKTK